jgi:hypothetical protein
MSCFTPNRNGVRTLQYLSRILANRNRVIAL